MFAKASPEEVNLERANLEGANLEGANLEEASLEEASLEEASLEEASAKLPGCWPAMRVGVPLASQAGYRKPEVSPEICREGIQAAEVLWKCLAEETRAAGFAQHLDAYSLPWKCRVAETRAAGFAQHLDAYSLPWKCRVAETQDAGLISRLRGWQGYLPAERFCLQSMQIYLGGGRSLHATSVLPAVARQRAALFLPVYERRRGCLPPERFCLQSR